MSVPTEITRIKGLRDDIRSRLIQIGALSDANADLEACRDAMANVSTLMLDHIAITTPPDKTIYTPGETFDPTGMVVTAHFLFGDTIISFNVDDYTYPTEPLELDTDEITIGYTFVAITKTATEEIATVDIDEDLDENSWETIAWIAERGLGSTYWNIGDRKAITLYGNIGDYLSISSPLTLYVYILDFNHPENGVPQNNIIFGGFFTEKTGGKDVCLVDSKYQATPDSHYYTNSASKKRFALNYRYYETGKGTTGTYMDWYPRNDGGWKGCTSRYNIFGATSTDSRSESYYVHSGKAPNVYGYDATQDTIDNPVEKSIMAILPSDFRSVLKLRTHYTENKGGSQTFDGSGQYITETTDAISLLTEYEITGAIQYSSPDEQLKQSQMAYYANGGSKIKYKHNDTNTAAIWFTASPRYNDGAQVCCVDTGGNITAKNPNVCYGIAPVFKV